MRVMVMMVMTMKVVMMTMVVMLAIISGKDAILGCCDCTADGGEELVEEEEEDYKVYSNSNNTDLN